MINKSSKANQTPPQLQDIGKLAIVFVSHITTYYGQQWIESLTFSAFAPLGENIYEIETQNNPVGYPYDFY